jgi:hypothetical protein
MKKIFLIALLAISTQWLQAQLTSFTLSPGTFNAEDEVTITVDMTGTGMAGETEAYVWIWANGGNPPGFVFKAGVVNTDWGNSPAAAKMTNIGPNRFTFKFTGVDMFSAAPAELKHFQFLCKSKNGSKQTQDANAQAFEPLVFVPTVARVFPSRIGQGDAVTVYFHQDLTTVEAEKRMRPTHVVLSVYDLNGTQVGGSEQTLPLTDEGDKVFSYSFVPALKFTLPPGTKLGKFRYRFKGTGLDTNGQPVNVETANNEKSFDL